MPKQMGPKKYTTYFGIFLLEKKNSYAIFHNAYI